MGTEAGEADPLLYEDIKMQISFPHFLHFRCKTLATGALLHTGNYEDAV